MTRRELKRALTELARWYGVETAYDDISNRRQQASPETLFLTLRALGAPLSHPRDAADAGRARRAELENQGIEPVLVAWGGRLGTVGMRLPAGEQHAIRYTLRLEDGTVQSGDAVAERIASRTGTRPSPTAIPTHRARIAGTLPLGYHDLEVESAAGVFTARVIAAPRTAHLPADEKNWGVFMPLYAVRGPQLPGIGTYADLESLARWTAARGGSFVGTLPLLPAFLDVGFEPSPYAPVSRLFWNELFIDVNRAPGFDRHAAAQHARRSGTAHDPGNIEGNGALRVDYRGVAAAQTTALRSAAESYFAAGDTTELDRYAAAHPRLADYARFRAVHERRREAWHAWPERMRDGELRDGDFAPEDMQYHMYAQWVADTQLASISRASERDAASLYLDLPLGVNADGYDAWRERDLFAGAASTGAPPDALFTGGQDWGFRPPDPAAQRRTGHRYFIECLRHHFRHARMLRLDHVMSLYRLYWIPAGLDARSGAYVRYPAEELFAILALESQRHQAVVVGEDLGTVPRQVRALMEKRKVGRMYVVQYELSPDSPRTINEVPRDVVASVNTHDMPTLAGYLAGADLDDQLDLGLVDAEGHRDAVAAREHIVERLRSRLETGQDANALLRGILGYLGGSDGRTVLVNLEDLWLEPAPQNVPGTSTERPNWQRRASTTLDDIMSDADIADILTQLDRTRQSVSVRTAEGAEG